MRTQNQHAARMRKCARKNSQVSTFAGCVLKAIYYSFNGFFCIFTIMGIQQIYNAAMAQSGPNPGALPYARVNNLLEDFSGNTRGTDVPSTSAASVLRTFPYRNGLRIADDRYIFHRRICTTAKRSARNPVTPAAVRMPREFARACVQLFLPAKIEALSGINRQS